MALLIEASYSKKLGLPGYSSHQFSVTIRTELTDISQFEAESSRLYHLLQASVDREIQATGFLPGAKPRPESKVLNPTDDRPIAEWSCSPRQRELILRLIEENDIKEDSLEQMAASLFGCELAKLTRVQASQLITEVVKQCALRPVKG